PLLGTTFKAEDDRDGAPGTVLLGWGLWQTAFGGDPGAVGRSVTLDGERMTIVGVMPRSFVFPSRETQFWQPLRLNADAYSDRTNTFLKVVGRLRPGVPMEKAASELNVIAGLLEQAYPKENARVGAAIVPLGDLGRQTRTLVLALLGAAA